MQRNKELFMLQVGFLWAWNHMIPNKKWKSLVVQNSADGEIFQLKMLKDFRDFCANSENRLLKFWQQAKDLRVKWKLQHQASSETQSDSSVASGETISSTKIWEDKEIIWRYIPDCPAMSAKQFHYNYCWENGDWSYPRLGKCQKS